MRLYFLVGFVALLSACAGPKYTVDDGRKVNEQLLQNIQTFGGAENSLRGAIARSADLKDKECDKQWELPFSVTSSAEWTEDDRVAWVRGLGVDERLTVIGVASGSPLRLKDKIQEIDGYHRDNSEKMLLRLAEKRDDGRPFPVKLAGGQSVKVRPFEVCRGYTKIAPPNTPQMQDYHWLMSIHPLEINAGGLDDDEALWVVLWTQGVSELGGLRMKTYHYGTEAAKTFYNIFTIATGIQGAAMAAQATVVAAQAAAQSAATSVIRQQLLDQASAAARSKIIDSVSEMARNVAQQQMVNGMQKAAANRGALTGVAWVASTVFEDADKWAFERMEKLHANPMGVLTLHEKLIGLERDSNAMVLDPKRMKSLTAYLDSKGRRSEMEAILQGIRFDSFSIELAEMPMASDNDFAYEDLSETGPSGRPKVMGFIDTMLNTQVDAQDK